MLTGDPVWDGIGTLGIGILLGAIAAVLIVEMKSLLIGEGATPEQNSEIRTNLVDGARIDRVIHLRTEYLGPDELLIAAKVAIRPGLEIADIAQAIDDAEARVRAAVPAARLMYIEPDLYRTQPL
jgi:divalent metal cation (Fe/Co/Zn/Cd) transporter